MLMVLLHQRKNIQPIYSLSTPRLYSHFHLFKHCITKWHFSTSQMCSGLSLEISPSKQSFLPTLFRSLTTLPPDYTPPPCLHPSRLSALSLFSLRFHTNESAACSSHSLASETRDIFSLELHNFILITALARQNLRSAKTHIDR